MKRRNLLHTGIAAVLLLSTGACEDFKFGNAFLDKPFTTDITIDTVYAHKVYAEQALAEVYRSLPDYLPSGGRLCWGILGRCNQAQWNTLLLYGKCQFINRRYALYTL